MFSPTGCASNEDANENVCDHYIVFFLLFFAFLLCMALSLMTDLSLSQ